MLKALTTIIALSAATATSSDTLAAAPAQGDTELILADSRLDNVRLVAADAAGQWTVKRDGDAGEKVFAARKVVRFGHFVQPAGLHRVRLAAGGELVGYS